MAKKKEWAEDELIDVFGLTKVTEGFELLDSWLDTSVQLTETEAVALEKLRVLALEKADFWNEETLKMRFVAPLLHNFVKLYDKKNRYDGFFDKEISANVDGIDLQTETDFMLAKGVGDIAKTPYFHFQEYKRSKKSPPEPMAQLIEAFLIAQVINNDGKPLYGAEIFGAYWRFVIMEGKEYCVSEPFNSTNKESLLQIIAILRKFRHILETRLIGNDE